MTFDEAWAKLARSPFRSRFHLSAADREYCCRQGLAVIRRHAADFIRERLAPAHPANDGRQTPMRGHPVFVAQHAIAVCCRGCLGKWWHVPPGRELTAVQQEKLVNFLMQWICRELGETAVQPTVASDRQTPPVPSPSVPPASAPHSAPPGRR